MELNKCISNLNSTFGSMSTAIRNDMQSIVIGLMSEFDIRSKVDNKLIDNDRLLSKLLGMYKVTNEEYCCAITKASKRCTRKSQPNSEYCKIHGYKTIIDKRKEEYIGDAQLYFVESNTKQIDKSLLQTEFINDSFYYVDEQYVYDIQSLDKVGYVEEEDGTDKNYFLTDDPFILNSCGY